MNFAVLKNSKAKQFFGLTQSFKAHFPSFLNEEIIIVIKVSFHGFIGLVGCVSWYLVIAF